MNMERLKEALISLDLPMTMKPWKSSEGIWKEYWSGIRS